jgi:hypothetical protein
LLAVMMRSDPVAESWRERNHKVIKGLKLRYPTPTELNALAALAKVDNATAFGDHVKSIILDAHLTHAALHSLSIPKVKKALKGIRDRARALALALERIDIVNKGSDQRAGMLLEWELNHPLPAVGSSLIPRIVADLESLSDAASRGARRAKAGPGPKGATGSPAFNPFIEALLIAALQRGGNWTNYRSPDGTWRGTLLDAVQLLKPCLPNKFLPQSVLGRSIENIRRKLKHYTTES